MAFIGGFLGAYALLSRCDMFANAQTTNMISIAMGIVGRNPLAVLSRLGALLIYIFGIMITVLLPKVWKISLHYVAVAVDAAVVIILGFMPENMNPVIALYPVFLAAAIQWNSFPEVSGYSCSTIFSTNNLRQFTVASTQYFCDRDKAHANKARCYGGTLLFYHLGVVFSYFAYRFLALQGVWLGLLPVLLAASMVIYENSDLNIHHFIHPGKKALSHE